ncbi:MAG: type II toxin-antitoxin system Phd/YefM family antitoxin [Oscillospiraceae bacterium]|nr:type II toxin-antitoxin system Phd/YefM family antitoxin [Oscillospiraceae bacterium]
MIENFTNTKENFKELCDKVWENNEPLLITRKNSKNMILLTIDQYDEFVRASENLDYLLKLNESARQAEEGKLTRITAFDHEGEED